MSPMIPASAPIAMMARATTTSVHSVFATSWVGSGTNAASTAAACSATDFPWVSVRALAIRYA